MISYLQVDVDCEPHCVELLIAEMSNLGYDSFWEKENNGFAAYIDSNEFKTSILDDLIARYFEINTKKIAYQVSKMEQKNWNQEWERNFEPIIIDNQCFVRATFHAPHPNIPFEIIIDPKMSFGTGHHATTSMMLRHILKNTFIGKSAMDVGCGTGILSIAASKLGANQVIGFDIEDWTVENAKENKLLNNIKSDIQFFECTIQSVPINTQTFDYIFANINRNVLLEELKWYVNYMNENSKLIISGFYNEDQELIDAEATKIGLEKTEKLIDTNWCSIVYKQKMAN